MKLIDFTLLLIKILIINQFFCLDFYKPNPSFSSEKSNHPTTSYLKNVPENNFYILGPGDLINIKINEDTKELNSEYLIDGEGTIDIKRLKRIYVKGLTKLELTNLLNEAYLKYVKKPSVEISIISYRPVTVYIDGEISDPGTHTLPGSNSPYNSIENIITSNNSVISDDNSSNNVDSDSNNVYFPSLIDFIRKSNGITQYADLENIIVTRQNPISKGGGRVKSKLNLMDTLNLIDSSQNIRILDGDQIFISKNSVPVFSQIKKAIRSNLNPRFVSVLVGGRVEFPGQIRVSKSATLNEAILIAGGTKVLKGPINFLRYNNDGSYDRRKFKYRKDSKRGSYKNPFLVEGDIIFVGRSNISIFTETFNEVTSPLSGIASSIGLYKLITD